MEMKGELVILTKQEFKQLLQTIDTLEATVKAQQVPIRKQENIKKREEFSCNKFFSLVLLLKLLFLCTH